MLSAPLNILRPREERPLRKFLSCSTLVFLLTAGTLLLPAPAGLSAAGHRALALFIFTGSVLALESISLPIAALMVPVAAVILNVATINQALAPFSRPIVFLVLASLFLADRLATALGHPVVVRLRLVPLESANSGQP